MECPKLPDDETQRLKSLHTLRVLDTNPEARFDRITSMAARVFDVEICLVSLVDSERQWFKSRKGLEACETSRDISFCGHAILEEAVFVVEDTLTDARFEDNPLVTDNPSIRFYAGCPVHAPDGHRVGTLCLIDSRARKFDQKDARTLADFAALVDDELATSSKIHVDELTGVANRRGFGAVADHVLPLAKRIDLGIELLYFDLDSFKELNDELGHQAGDEALRKFASILLKTFRRADVVARLGGDEFAVMMVNCDAFSNRGVIAMRELADQDDSEVGRRLQWSIGRTRYAPDVHEGIESLLHDADTRMYAHKVGRRSKAG